MRVRELMIETAKDSVLGGFMYQRLLISCFFVARIARVKIAFAIVRNVAIRGVVRGVFQYYRKG